MTIKLKCTKCGRTYVNYNDLCPICRGVEPNPCDIEVDNLDFRHPWERDKEEENDIDRSDNPGKKRQAL